MCYQLRQTLAEVLFATKTNARVCLCSIWKRANTSSIFSHSESPACSRHRTCTRSSCGRPDKEGYVLVSNKITPHDHLVAIRLVTSTSSRAPSLCQRSSMLHLWFSHSRLLLGCSRRRVNMAHNLSNCRVLKEEPLASSDAKWTQLKKYASQSPISLYMVTENTQE
jgi:hypothetical protein